MNEVSQGPNTSIAALQQLKSGLSNVRQAIPRSGGDPFLRMMKDGQWVYGADDVEVDEAQQWAINPLTIEHGWIAWLERGDDEDTPAKMLGERMVSMQAPLPPKDELPHFENGKWTQQVALQFKGVGGEHNGVQVLYKTNSHGGKQAASKLIDAILDQVGSEAVEVVPLVTLFCDPYKHKKWGRLYNPIIKVIGWTTLDVPEASAKANAPAKRQAAAPEPETEEYDDETTPSEPVAEDAGNGDRRVRRRRR